MCFSFSVPQMLAMMVDLEDDDEWAMADELEDDDFDRYRDRRRELTFWPCAHLFYLILLFV